MSKKTKNKENIYLLAEGCLKRGNHREIEALFELSDDFNMDFFYEIENGFTLLELFSKKTDGKLLESVFNKAIEKNKSDKNKEVKIINILLENKKWDVCTNVIKSISTDDFIWKSVENNDKIKKMTLQDDWEENKLHIEKIIPEKTMNGLEEFKSKNKWLVSKNKTEFNKLIPHQMSKQEILMWWQEIQNDKKNTRKDSWWKVKILEEHDEWKKFDENDIKTVISSQRQGNIFYYYPLNTVDNNNSQKMINKLQKLIFEKLDFSDKITVQDFICKELVLAGKIRKNTDLNSSYWGYGNGNLRYKSQQLKKLGRVLNEFVDKMEAHTPSNMKNNFMIGALKALNYHLLVRTTSLNDDAVNLFSKASNLPKTFDSLMQQSFFKQNTFENVFTPEQITVLGFHILKSLESMPIKMKEFATSMHQYIENNKQNDEVYCRMISSWANKLSENAINKEAKQVWAGLFWKNVFNLSGANQHQYLKKAAKNKNIQTKLDFWNNNFADMIEKQTESRKRTKDINTVLAKMNLINSIAISVNVESKPTRSGRKM